MTIGNRFTTIYPIFGLFSVPAPPLRSPRTAGFFHPARPSPLPGNAAFIRARRRAIHPQSGTHRVRFALRPGMERRGRTSGRRNKTYGTRRAHRMGPFPAAGPREDPRQSRRPAKAPSSCFGSTQVRNACRPEAIISRKVRRVGGIAPQGKDRFHARSGQLLDSIGPNVFQKQIAECEANNARSLGSIDQFAHAPLVIRVRAGPGQRHGPERQPDALRWRSTSSRRTACMATRSTASLNVVTRPTTSTSAR